MYANLRSYITALDLETIAPPRRDALIALSKRLPTSLLFVCTHNSRRSHFGQIWAATMAAHCELEGVDCHSGGTEVTAFNPRAVAAIERAGFAVSESSSDASNPHYVVRRADEDPGLTCFSKRWDAPANPKQSFGAVMTCTEADQACPAIAGADFRLALPYDDPKSSDGTPQEQATYDARCRQIATEMLYVMRAVRERG